MPLSLEHAPMTTKTAILIANMRPKGLLPLLKSIQKPTELKKFSGEILGVDAYGWLHRGAVSCAIELAQGRPTSK